MINTIKLHKVHEPAIKTFLAGYVDDLIAHRCNIPTVTYGEEIVIQYETFDEIGEWCPISEILSIFDPETDETTKANIRRLAEENGNYCHSCKKHRNCRTMAIVNVNGNIEFWGGECLRFARFVDLIKLCEDLARKQRRVYGLAAYDELDGADILASESMQQYRGGLHFTQADHFFNFVFEQLQHGIFLNHEMANSKPYNQISIGETAAMAMDIPAVKNHSEQYREFVEWVNKFDYKPMAELADISKVACRKNIIVKESCRPVAAMIRVWYRDYIGNNCTAIENTEGRITRNVAVVDWQEDVDYYGVTTRLILKTDQNELLVWNMRGGYDHIFEYLDSKRHEDEIEYLPITFSVKSNGKFGKFNVSYITRGKIKL